MLNLCFTFIDQTNIRTGITTPYEKKMSSDKEVILIAQTRKKVHVSVFY